MNEWVLFNCSRRVTLKLQKPENGNVIPLNGKMCCVCACVCVCVFEAVPSWQNYPYSLSVLQNKRRAEKRPISMTRFPLNIAMPSAQQWEERTGQTRNLVAPKERENKTLCLYFKLSICNSFRWAERCSGSSGNTGGSCLIAIIYHWNNLINAILVIDRCCVFRFCLYICLVQSWV